ncbi:MULTISPECIES: TonB-dependent receptor domain-containing protein [unclassified Hephaestia]|uniref:TonB-dependent receptor domain-containing protein n=1 Tax=unclassified Hephaestia TaxID=2631281 RepID=UPI0020773842|nr:TonB-dependent receptor [Hephaestia sp. MAHUQ-44]MCM8732348.1 TonB-dependent receptor [Hephaestia sp. MAHUQ-44]
MEQAVELGRISAIEALELDPALGTSQNLSSSVRGWDAGISAVNLRDLGTNRSLTLIDGQRRVSGSARSSAVDIGMIPVSMIDRIEVVTGGAAAIYGADAVTGAVNVITKRNIEGLHISGMSGISEQGDAAKYLVSVATGGKFADGRGTFSIGGAYSQSNPLIYTDRFDWRDWPTYRANPANTGIGDGIPDRVYSPHTRQIYYDYVPTYWLGGKRYIVENGNVREGKCGIEYSPGQYAVCDGGDGRNLSDNDQFQGGLKSLALMGRVDYQVTDAIEFGTYFSYARQKYDGTYHYWRDDSRTTYFSSAVPGGRGASAMLDNPYLPDSVRQVMLDNNLTSLYIDRAYGIFPIIEEDHDRESYTIGSSLGGKLGSRFKWEAFWQYGRVTDNVTEGNVPWKSHWIAARDAIADPVTGEPICRDAAARAQGCVPFDIFSTTPVNEAQIKWALADRNERRVNTQQIFGANINGPLFTLPYGDVSVAVGAEHRKETLKTRDDPLALIGELVYGGGPATHPDLDESFTVSEAYGELVVPLLSDLPFARRLEVEGAYRYSDYSTVGSTHAWKAGAMWSPVGGISFRGVRSRSVRTPNFGELYEAKVERLTGAYTDACSLALYYASETRAANCKALGIDTPFETPRMGPVVVTGGNPDLKPETSNSLTLGVILQPSFVPGLDVTVDYWDIDIKNVITQFSYDTLIRLCVDAPTIDNPYCARVTRDPVTGHATRVESNQLNAARLYARGIDIGLAYHRPLGPGTLNLSFKGSYLLDKVTETTPGIPEGDIKYDGAWGNPRFRGNLLTSYKIDNFNVALNTRFISAATYELNTDSDEAFPHQHIPAKVYNDLTLQYRIADKYQLGVGVNNISNTMPKYLPGIFRDTTVYGVVGRYFFTTIKMDF